MKPNTTNYNDLWLLCTHKFAYFQIELNEPKRFVSNRFYTECVSKCLSKQLYGIHFLGISILCCAHSSQCLVCWLYRWCEFSNKHTSRFRKQFHGNIVISGLPVLFLFGVSVIFAHEIIQSTDYFAGTIYHAK